MIDFKDIKIRDNSHNSRYSRAINRTRIFADAADLREYFSAKIQSC